MTPEDKAQQGIKLLKESVLETIQSRRGITTVDITQQLDLHIPNNDYGMKSQYLTTSILALLRDGVRSTGGGGRGNPRQWFDSQQ